MPRGLIHVRILGDFWWVTDLVTDQSVIGGNPSEQGPTGEENKAMGTIGLLVTRV